MTPSLEALKKLSKTLINNSIDHGLGGSGLMYSLGILKDVRDWDITVDAPKEKVLKAINGFNWTYVENSEVFKSDYLLKIVIDTTEIEIIGGFNIKKEDGFMHKVPLKISGYWNEVPVADPYEWMLAYKFMGRNNKAKLLEEYLNSN